MEYEYNITESRVGEPFKSPGPGWEFLKVDNTRVDGVAVVTWKRPLTETPRQPRVLLG